MEVYRLLGQDLCLCEKSRFPLNASEAMKDFSIGIMLSHIMLAAEELWMELQTVTEEQFAAKVYKNGDYVATLSRIEDLIKQVRPAVGTAGGQDGEGMGPCECVGFWP